MITSYTRFAAIAVAAAGIVTAQGASAGVLFTHTGGNAPWISASSWTGGAGIPAQPTADARLISTTSVFLSNNIGIGGIQGDAGSRLTINRNGSAQGTLTLNGITPGGTTPFTSSSLNHLFIEDDGIFVNTGSSNLTVNRLDVTESGRFRSFPNALGRLDFTGGAKIFRDNAEMDNYGTLELRSFMAVQDNAVINNDNGGTFIHAASQLAMSNSSLFRNDATFNKTGGDLVLLDSSLIRNSEDFTQTSGTTNIGTSIFATSSRFNNTGTYRHDGGVTNVFSGARLDNFSLVEHNDGALTVHGGGTFDNTGDLQINGGTVQVNGGGTLNGLGFTTLNGGTLRVNGEMVQTGFNGFVTGLTINGGTLAGNGTVRSDIDNTGGTVGPGNSPGTLTVDGNYTQGSGGTLAMEIESLLSFDVLDITGIAALDGILDLTVDAGYAAAAQDGDSFTIVEWDSFSGAFATVNGLNFAADKFFTLNYGASGLTLTVNAETVVGVAEPGMIALFGLGLAGLGFMRRRRS